MGRNCHHIPEELVEEILLRSPVKSLLRFKCVCKSWSTLISSRSFAYKHVSYDKKNGSSSASSVFFNRISMVLNDGPDDNFRPEVTGLITISNNDDDKDNDNDDGGGGDSLFCAFEGFNLSDIFEMDYSDRLIVVCHCDGIISLTFLKGRKTVFYNPAIRDLKSLPTSLLPKEYEIGAVGFGYDSKANDYKFVRISRIFRTEKYIAELYTLGSDSWKQIKLELENGTDHRIWDLGVYSKGVYFWLVPREDPVQTILAFDMSNDEFHSLPLPDSMQRENKILLLQVALWNESVTAIFTAGKYGCFEFWVMDDYIRGGVKGTVSWTKQLGIGPLDGLNWPILLWMRDELLVVTNLRLLASYNLRTQKTRNLSFRELEPGTWYADSYVPSLVPVNRRN